MKNKYDDLLIQGLTKLKNLEFAYVSNAGEINYSFSEKYISNKERLIKNLGRPYWKYINTVAKKAAVIIVALIIAFSSLMTVDAFREMVVNFVYKIYATFTEIVEDTSTNKDSLLRQYVPKHIPESYTKEITSLYSGLVTNIYTNQNEQVIAFTQNHTSNFHQFNSEHGTLYETVVNDTPCLVCKDNDLYYCYWEFDGYRFELIYPLDLGEEFMSEVVGNLVEIDPDELND